MVFRRLLRSRKRICIFVAVSILFMIAFRRSEYEEVDENNIEPLPKLPFLDPVMKGRNLGMLLNNLQYQITPRDVCRPRSDHLFKNQNRTIICMVHSSRENFNARQKIRDTYGSVKSYQQWSIFVIFLVGLAPNNEDSKIGLHLGREIKSQGDILVGNFEDTYSNLLWKHLLGYKFMAESCNHTAKYYIKTDDNSIVNIFHIVESLIKWESRHDNDFYCRVDKDFNEFGKPDYCGYSIYLTSMKTVRRIYSEVNLGQVYFSRYDDFFITGNVRASVNRRIKNGTTVGKINLVQAKVMYFDTNNYNDETQNAKTDIKIFGNPKENNMWLGIIVQSRSTKLTCGLWLTIRKIHKTQTKSSGVCG